MIKIIRYEEVKPGIWRYAISQYHISGASRQPLLDGCRKLLDYIEDHSIMVGLFRESYDEPDLSCRLGAGALTTVDETGPRFRRFKAYPSA